MTAKLGIYIHVPFCDGAKCPYCDFYSVPYRGDLTQAYLEAAEREIKKTSPRAKGRTVDTVYFGGGTPALLKEGLIRLLDAVRANYSVESGAEITFEANPAGDYGKTYGALRRAGFNRLSLGMQSALPQELKRLGRRHSSQDTARAVDDARKAGFDNISLDLMLATPGQTEADLVKSIDFAASLGPQHLSAYLLKVEPGTPFAELGSALSLPDGDTQAEFYEAACEAIEKHGFTQYEISNFALPGRASRHNLKYWDCDEYLGFGPCAHSFLDGRRFYYERNLEQFLKAPAVTDDGPGGTLEEYLMLRLRLSDGVQLSNLRERYRAGFEVFDGAVLASLMKGGYVIVDESAVRLTVKGFLMSNSVISTLLFKNFS